VLLWDFHPAGKRKETEIKKTERIEGSWVSRWPKGFWKKLIVAGCEGSKKEQKVAWRGRERRRSRWWGMEELMYSSRQVNT
jgi:hypothetical protein